MRTLLVCALIGLTLFSCASLPRIHDSKTFIGTKNDDCPGVFPQGNWQFVHAIEAVAPGGYRGLLMGVCNISPSTRSIHCVMMTIEGFVLFEAELKKDILNIKRGIPPFDSTAFARGMMEDIRFIFFRPSGILREVGFLKNGERVCRFTEDTGNRDVVLETSGGVEIIEYAENNRVQRHVTVGEEMFNHKNPKVSIPRNILLEASKGYSIRMDLVEATFLD